MLRSSTRYLYFGFTLSLGLVLVGMFDLGVKSIKAASVSPASSFFVTNTNDGGSGSLREAIADANANPGTDLISITANGTLLLLSPLPTISEAVTIQGPGADQFAIDGNESFRVLDINASDVIITDLSVQNGMVSGPEYGAGIKSTGNLFLERVEVLSNTAQSYGGGLYVTGALTMTEGGVRNNSSTNNAGGGMRVLGVTNISGTNFVGNSSRGDGGGAYVLIELVIVDAVFQDNRCTGTSCDGGGLFSFSQTEINNTQFIGNRAVDQGGGVAAPGNLMITGSLFLNNEAESGTGGGLYAQDFVTIEDTQFLSNTANSNGGGLYAFAATDLNGVYFQNNQSTIGSGGGLHAGGDLNLDRVRFVGNTAAEGAGLTHALGNAHMVNSLFANNVATVPNGGAVLLSSEGLVEILHVTIAGQSNPDGSAIEVITGTTMITNTIITSYDVGINNQGASVQEDFNLFFGNGVDTQGIVGGGDNSLIGDPKFVDSTAGDYHIGEGSAALNMGIDAGVDTDFDGEARPLGLGFDIGFDELILSTFVSRLPLILK